MMKKVKLMIAILMCVFLCGCDVTVYSLNEPEYESIPQISTKETIILPEEIVIKAVPEKESIVKETPMTATGEITECIVENDIYELSEDDIALIALITMAEAEGECEEGKRLVIDTILNRVDSSTWPNTVYEVVYQPSQFSCVWNGRVNSCYVSEDICNLVREELECRTNYDVVYFTAGGYGAYGTPLFSVGNHYFAGH